jgi:hypothetical protein
MPDHAIVWLSLLILKIITLQLIVKAKNLVDDVVKIEAIPKNLEGEHVLDMLMLDGTRWVMCYATL